MSDEIQVALIAEQFKHALDLQQARLDALAAEMQHLREFYGHRLSAIERQAEDHESRLRLNSEGVTQFKTWAGLTSGGSAIMSVVALIRSFFAAY